MDELNLDGYEFVSVTIWMADTEMDPWTSVFSNRDKAERFKEKAEKIIAEHGLDLLVTIDAGDIDSESYLDCLEATFVEDEDEYKEEK